MAWRPDPCLGQLQTFPPGAGQAASPAGTFGEVDATAEAVVVVPPPQLVVSEVVVDVEVLALAELVV